MICCNLISEYNAAKWLRKYNLLSRTLQHLLLLDREQLLVQMATDDKYLNALQLFEKRICFANARTDLYVAMSSGLIMSMAMGKKLEDKYWNKMICQKDSRFLIEELDENEMLRGKEGMGLFRKHWTGTTFLKITFVEF